MKATMIFATALLLAAAVPPPAPCAAAAPISVKIEGFVGDPPPGVKVVVRWRVSADDRAYDVHVTKLRTLNGPLSPLSVIKRLEPYPVAFSLAGEPAVVGALTAAPIGRPLLISGFLQMEHGSRVLTLSKVEPNVPPTPAALLGGGYGSPPPDANGALPPPIE